MFKIQIEENNEVTLAGRFDASREEEVKSVLNEVQESITLNFQDLEYISSAGLGVLLATQKRLREIGHQLKLINMNNHVRDVFRYSGLDMIFEIE